MEIPHFKDGKVTVSLSVDEREPMIDGDRLKQGGVFLTLRADGDKKTIFLNDNEVAFLAYILNSVLERHATATMTLSRKLRDEYRKKALKKQGNTKQRRKTQDESRDEVPPEFIEDSEI